jgi:hypothetical protein
LLSERLSYLGPGGNPNTVFGGDVFDKVLQSFEAARPANDTAMQADGHHLWGACLTFFIQHVKCITDVFVPTPGTAEARAWSQELEVVTVIAVRNYQAALGLLALALLSEFRNNLSVYVSIPYVTYVLLTASQPSRERRQHTNR